VGYSQLEAIAQYGQFNQMAMSFINISIVLALSLSSSIVPSVAEYFAAKDLNRIKNQVSQAIHLVVIFALPSAAGLYVLAHQLTLLVFAEEAAGVPLAAVSGVVVFWSINLVSSAALQGMGRATVPVRNLIFGIAIKLVITYIYTPTPLGIKAAAMSTVVMFAVASLMNIYSLTKLVGFNFNFDLTLLRPGIAAAFMSVGVLAVYNVSGMYIDGNNWPTVLAILAGMIIYPVLLILMGGIRAEDVRRLPGPGARMASFLEKMGRV